MIVSLIVSPVLEKLFSFWLGVDHSQRLGRSIRSVAVPVIYRSFGKQVNNSATSPLLNQV